LRVLAEDKEQTLAVETAGPISVRCDPAILHQALLNLLYNAIRYTPSEGTIRVSARATPSGEAAIAVVDTGPGIPIEHRERIFERFYRVDKARSRAPSRAQGRTKARRTSPSMANPSAPQPPAAESPSGSGSSSSKQAPDKRPPGQN